MWLKRNIEQRKNWGKKFHNVPKVCKKYLGRSVVEKKSKVVEKNSKTSQKGVKSVLDSLWFKKKE